MTWPRRWALKVLRAFELGDHEYIRGEWLFRYPWRFWLVVYEERYRRGWRKAMPWRIRTAWASVLIDLLVRRCPGCERRFTYAELVGREGELDRYMSGTTWHRECRLSGVHCGSLFLALNRGGQRG